MADQRIAPTAVEFEKVAAILRDVGAACAALPKEERDRYEEAQRSIVDARRSAEMHEGLLQVC